MGMLRDIKPLLPELIETAKRAGKEILEVYEKEISVQYKDDRSPLTEADRRSHRVITKGLKSLTPDVPVLSEEGSGIDYTERSQWQEFWLVDPLDGTKEFIKRNGEFTINIALIRNQKPVFGLILIPVKEVIYYGGPLVGGLYKCSTREDVKDYLSEHYRVKSEGNKRSKAITVVGSRSHGSERLTTFVEKLKSRYKDLNFVSAGSALKFCLVAEGRADLYPRFGPTMEWDTGAGHALLLSAGSTILRADTLTELTYNKESLRNPDFIVIGKALSEDIISFFHE